MSLRAYLRNQYQPEDVFPAETWPEVARIEAQPSSYPLVEGHFFYNMRQALKPDTPVVAVLREPLTRTLSGLRHLKRDPNFHYLHAQAAGRSIQQLLRDPVIMDAQANVQAAALCASAPPHEVVRYLARTLLTRPGAEASDLEEPPTLELALQRLEEIDFIGTMEDLPLLVTEMAKTMSYHPASRLSLANEAPGSRTTLNGLDSEDVEILREHNRIDLELYRRATNFATFQATKRALLALVANGTYVRPTGAFTLDLGGPVPGFGWHEAERDGEVVWRWTGPEPNFTIELCLQRGISYHAEIRFSAAEDFQPNSLSLCINGTSIRVALEQHVNSFIARWHMPSSLTYRHDGCCHLVFSIETTRRLGNDLRKLGIAVNQMAFVPEQDV